MAKTDWGMNDTVMPADMNQMGEEINTVAAVANSAEEIATVAAGAAASAVDELSAATAAATLNTLVKRDAAGRMKVAAPAAADDVPRQHNVMVPPYAVTTGTGAAYTAAYTPAFTVASLVAGARVTVRPHLANTGAATLNINGLGAKAILKSNGNALSAGNLKLNSVYTLVYDGTNFILQGEGGEYGTAIASDVVAGKTIGTDAGLVTGTIVEYGGDEYPGYHRAAGRYSDPGRVHLIIEKGLYRQDISGNPYTGIFSDDPNFIASNIRSGVNVFGLAGTLVEEEVFSAGNVLILSDPFTRYGNNGPTPKFVRSHRINRNGIYRITFSMSSHGNVAYGQIYKNTVPYGIVHGRANSDLGDYTQDLYFAKGDECALYLWASDYSAASVSGGMIFRTSNNPNPTLWNTGA